MVLGRDAGESFVEELKASIQTILSDQVTKVLFYSAVGLWLVYHVLDTSFALRFLVGTVLDESSVLYYVILLVLPCELGRICNIGYRSQDAYGLLALVVLCVGTCARMYIPLLGAALLVFCARSFDVRKTVAFCTVVVACTVLAVMICAGVGIIPDVVMDERTRVRHCLGFLFFLHPSMYAFMLTCCVCYLRGRDLSVVEGVLLLAANVLMYKLTDSQTSFGLSMLVVAAVLALKVPVIGRLKLEGLWKALSWSWLIALVASIALTLLYGVLHGTGITWMDTLDAATRGRFSYGWNGIHEFGITALGQYVPWQGNGLGLNGYNPHIATYNYVDNMFMHLLFEQGWVYVLGLVVLCTAVGRRAYREGDHTLLIALAGLAAYAILNDLTMYLHYNLLYFLIAGLYVPARQKEDLQR